MVETQTTDTLENVSVSVTNNFKTTIMNNSDWGKVNGYTNNQTYKLCLILENCMRRIVNALREKSN